MNYNLLYRQLEALLENEEDLISKMANFSAFLYHNIEQLNWVGFYIVKGGVLKLGPFQGKPACNNIPKGRGVCGTCWEKLETIVVEDVHKFKGHIACDSESNSEVVIPFVKSGEMLFQLDIDSPILNRFDKDLVEFLERAIKVFEN